MPKVAIRCTETGLEVILELDLPREAVVLDLSSNELRCGGSTVSFHVARDLQGLFLVPFQAQELLLPLPH